MRCSLALLALFSHISSSIARQDKESTLSLEYDFIIVGGGTTGLILADRLSESGEQKVLVLEAGPDPHVVAMHEAPGAVEYIAGTAIDWNFYTEAQQGLNGRKLAYHRGRGLGGSSILNGLYYGRGSANVYDHWVELGNPGWSWEEVYPSFIKSTRFNPPNNGTGYNQKYQTWDPSAYSNGPLDIGYQGFVPPSSVAFIDACAAIDLPIVQDLNNGKNVGVKQGTATLTSKYRRSSAYDYYKAASKRPNVDIFHNAPVQQITFSKNATGTPVATGVIFIDHTQGRFRTVAASKEVIVTLGTFQSPQMLMVSGIGPEATLDAYNIEPVVINENVGQHMMDHNLYSISATVVPEASTHQLMFNTTAVEASQDEYYTSGKGVYTAPGGITNGFQELSHEKLQEIGAKAVIDAGLTNRSTVEFLFESFFYPNSPGPTYEPASDQSYISISVSSMVALSKGNITIQSSGMSDAPIINPNYYTHPADRAIAINAFRDARKILAHPALANLTVGPDNGEVAPGVSNISSDDDDAIFEYIKATTVPNWHASGTNRMLPLEDGGVVDPRLRVYGVQGLRVIDSSIMPTVPDVNIAGPVYMLGEHGAAMIKQDWDISD
ncbi:glucose-methanol-choline oxidoreductase:gmc oxidoreductase [Fusarium beomiforme]|uniref:Glucose-methanol-choline oxidoreductase:gmc oxidoreductase n=1 Tax=Fusarium beomiforme TaxID=44412 RepID=A0A9P5APA6_9HYPO|nr:glucose-methanol-choline oxidoreductase:gmc oxidoreductase [Fusarium beomiforme]